MIYAWPGCISKTGCYAAIRDAQGQTHVCPGGPPARHYGRERRQTPRSAPTGCSYSLLASSQEGIIMQTPDNQRARMPLSVESAPTIGFVLSNEQFAAPYLVELGAAAEKAGF